MLVPRDHPERGAVARRRRREGRQVDPGEEPDRGGAAAPLSGETDAITSSGLNDPIYNPNPQSAAPAQAAARQRQVQKLNSQASFIGDVNVGADVLNSAYAAAYTNPQTGQVDPNEIYRAVIAPPPTDSGGHLLTEDPLVAASRMYNTAGLLITIDNTGGGTPTVHIGGRQSDGSVDPTAYDSIFASLNTQTATSVVGSPTNGTPIIRYPIVDPREALNGKPAVNVTSIDVHNLSTAITTALAAGGTAAFNLNANYNGVVYVYDKTDNTTVGNTANQPNMGSTLNGILVKNATTTPNISDSSGNPLGFTIVSDNGVYVQGDYNTTQITVSGQQVPNPSGIMGDAVTALSYGYDPTANHYDATHANNGLQAWSSRNATTSPGDSSPYGMTIDAAILTGNTPTNTTVSPVIKSGGAQNLVRLIENWYSDPNNLQLTITGSLGQLFSSKYFQGAWPGTGSFSALGGPAYLQPHQRNFSYDLNFQQRTPAGSPTTTSFHKGNFFLW